MLGGGTVAKNASAPKTHPQGDFDSPRKDRDNDLLGRLGLSSTRDANELEKSAKRRRLDL
jgi:hypothetical protein